MNSDKIYLAADSGGSKTIWSLISENGDEISVCRTDGMASVRPGMIPVEETVRKASEMLGIVPSGIYLSLGGPNVDEIETALESVWAGIPVIVEREATGNAVLYAAGFIGCKSVVMCGTGSVAVGDTKDGRKYSGGWGPAYGDGGSGGGLGSEALRIFLRSVDGFEDIGKVGELFSELTDGLDISEFSGRMKLKERAVNMSRRDLASLAPEIYTLAEQGDDVAQSLYSKAAEEIVLMANAVSDSGSVLLCGGFFKNKPKLLAEVGRLFYAVNGGTVNYNPNFSPIVAAKAAVLKNNGIEINKEIFNRILEDKLT